MLLISFALGCSMSTANTPTRSIEPTTTSGEHAGMAMEEPLYVCPMHPEVTSDKPGSCPKCGMALVKQTVAHPPAEPTDR